MKNLKYLLMGILFSGVVFSGCKKAKEVFDVEFDSSYNADLNVVVPPGPRNASFYESTLIDPFSDPDVKKYANKLKKFEVTELKARVINLSKEVNMVSCYISIYSDDRSANWNFDNLPLTDGTEILLDNSGGQWDDVSAIMMEKKAFTIKVEGTVEDDDVSFTMRIFIKAKVTANPL